MLFERKLTERELDSREAVIQGLLGNKRNLVKKYGKDAEKVMYGIATKKAKSKVEEMNKEKIRELIYKALTKEDNDPSGEYLEGDPDEHVEEGTCGYGEDGKIGRKPAGPHLNKEEYAADKNNVNVFGYQTKYYEVCPGAQAFMRKVVNGDYGDMSNKKREVIRLGQLHDVLFLREIKALKDPEYAARELSTAEMIADEIKSMVEFLDIPVSEVDYVDGHVEIIRNAAKKKNIKENIEEFEVDDAIMELRRIVDEIEEKADEARDIVRDIFPNELSRLDGYGAFSGMYSANRYDVTLGGFVDRLEEEGYEIEDGVAYVNEGHMMPMDDLDVGHTDNEPHMLKKELARAGQMIQMLYRAVDKYDGQGEVDFPQWWQKKIIQANAMLDSAFDYIDGEEMVAKIDAVIDNMDSVEVDIDVVNEEEDIQKRLDAEKAIRQTLKDEGGAAGLKPLVKAVKKFGFNKEDLIKLLKRTVKVDKHKHGDYILTPINEKELSKSDEKALKKISKALGGSSKAHKNQADRINKIIREKLLGVDEKKLTAAEKRKKEDIIMALKKQKGGKKNLEPVDYAVATDRAKKLAEKNEK